MQKLQPRPVLDPKACYVAMSTHDSRFDGRFFVGVSSTGIYCRPVCRVKLPKFENCSFFSNAAAAEASGYRPCMKCRPELAPGKAPIDSASRLAEKAVLIIEENSRDELKLAEVAEILNITDRHLRRIFFNEFGVTPVQYLQTKKMLLAKSLLTDTKISMADVAMAAGFNSIRRFNDLFLKQYGMPPGKLKKRIGREDQDEISVSLAYRPPYAWDNLLSFLGHRAVPGVEFIYDGMYRRTVAMEKSGKIFRGWVAVKNQKKSNTLSVTVSTGLLPVLAKVLARIRFLFDLNCDPVEVFEHLYHSDTVIRNLLVSGIRLPGSFDPFEISVRAVFGQQISVKAAQTIAGRFVQLYGQEIKTPFPELSFTFPLPEIVCAAGTEIETRLGNAGVTSARSRTVLALAEAVKSGNLNLSLSSDPATETKKLLDIPGIGQWTAQYIAMRALGWPDVFLSTDHGIRKFFPGMSQAAIEQLSEFWQPWRSYATINLWNSLSGE